MCKVFFCSASRVDSMSTSARFFDIDGVNRCTQKTRPVARAGFLRAEGPSAVLLHAEAHAQAVHASENVVIVKRGRDCLPGVAAGAWIVDGRVLVEHVFDIEVRIDAGADGDAGIEVEIPGAGEGVIVGGEVVGGGGRACRGAGDPVVVVLPRAEA